MRAEFIKCFVVKTVGKEKDAICNEDVFDVRKKISKYEKLSNVIYAEIQERGLFLDKEEKKHMSYYEMMIQCLGRWEEKNPEQYVNKHYVRVKRNELIYWTIFLKKTELYHGNAYDLLISFLKSIENDYRPKRCENGESIILYYVLKFNKSFEIWDALLKEWNEKKKRYLGEDLIEKNDDNIDEENEESKILYLNFPEGTKKLNYNSLKQFVDVGLSEVEQRTESSIREIKKLSSKLIDKGDETNIVNVFGDELLEHVGNCQKRRKWYMFRMMEQIIKYQIEKFILMVIDCQVKTQEFYKTWEKYGEIITVYYAEKQQNYGNGQLYNVSSKYTWLDLKDNFNLAKNIEIDKVGHSLSENKNEIIWYRNIPDEERAIIEKLIILYEELEVLYETICAYENEIWIFKDKNQKGNLISETWKEFCKDREKILCTSKETLEIELKNSRILPPQINRCFSQYFDGLESKGTNAMDKYGVRYNAYLKVPGFEGDMIKEKKSKIAERSGIQKIRDILLGKKEVTREMLLLMGLVHKAMLGENTSIEYLMEHVLYHSRYSMEFRDTPFERFVQNAYHIMDESNNIDERFIELKKLSRDVEMYYLQNRKIAIFSYIMGGKEVEV